MDDAKRFLRYLMPGAVFGVNTAVLLWLLRPDWMEDTLSRLADANGVGFAIAGLLGSGAVGFLCSVIHHELHWLPWLSTIDHTELIRNAVETGRLRVLTFTAAGDQAVVSVNQIDRRVAWTALASLWHSQLSDGPIKSADPRVASLSDTAHALGTARVAAFASLLAALTVAARVSSWTPSGWPLAGFAAAILLGVGLTALYWWAYWRTGRLTQAVIDEVFMASLYRAAPSTTLMVQRSMLPSTALQPTSGRQDSTSKRKPAAR